MLKTIALDFHQIQNYSAKNISNRTRMRPAFAQKNVKYWIIFLGLLNLGLLFSFVLSANSRVSLGYELSRLQKDKNIIVEENRKLKFQFSEQSSLSRAQPEITALNMVPAGEIVYLRNSALTQR